LVEHVEEFFDDRRKRGVTVIPDERRLGRAQFENVLRVAMGTISVREVINFIRYQIGRDRNNTGWGNNAFGEELIRKIDAVAKLDQSVSIDLVRLFLGFLKRHVVYERNKQGTTERS